MKSIILTDGSIAFVDDADYPVLSRHSWRPFKSSSKVYAVSDMAIGARPVLMHRLIMAVKSGQTIDHINGNSLDNQKCNLRPASTAEQAWNSRPPKGARSTYKGVSWHRKLGWCAGISVRNPCTGKLERKHLGYFKSDVETALAYDAAAIDSHSSFAWLNIRHFPVELFTKVLG